MIIRDAELRDARGIAEELFRRGARTLSQDLDRHFESQTNSPPTLGIFQNTEYRLTEDFPFRQTDPDSLFSLWSSIGHPRYHNPSCFRQGARSQA